MMKTFLLYLFLFLVGSMLGYLCEVLFRRFFSAKKWVNPGFMKGPWLPLYGFGIILMFTICIVFEKNLPADWRMYNPGDFMGLGYASAPTVVDLIPIATMGLGMLVLEFIAGLVFVKGFKVRLWDYSNMRGNILGIICPVFSVIWFAAGTIYYYGVHPFVYKAADIAYGYMFGSTTGGTAAHFGFIFLMGLVYGIIVVDLWTSAGIFAKISKFARESGITARYEKLQEDGKAVRRKAKADFYSRLPDKLKEELAKPKEPSKVLHGLKKMILIDPNTKKKAADNYDENGRPISEKVDKED